MSHFTSTSTPSHLLVGLLATLLGAGAVGMYKNWHSRNEVIASQREWADSERLRDAALARKADTIRAFEARLDAIQVSKAELARCSSPVAVPVRDTPTGWTTVAWPNGDVIGSHSRGQ